ncbi:hypothetical protein JRQ81_012964 [Phrynocephalus forsythii]|uniref:F-box domain-containing protein n=1 Tax=Phrynocephalus forsythii TaxID=171643 RepID=A0A9Q0Y1I0_9SAUR|nr:hypothetical protein JRQ81_012964 [Phrynocephalus forsythii]
MKEGPKGRGGAGRNFPNHRSIPFGSAGAASAASVPGGAAAAGVFYAPPGPPTLEKDAAVLGPARSGHSGTMAQGGGGGGGEWSRFESALRASLRLLRDRWAERGRFPGQARGVPASSESPPTPFSALEALPADVLLYIMSFLEPRDLSHLGSTNRYLRVTVQDPLLWRYLILRDLQSWHTIDWKSLPDAKIFNRSFAELNDNGTYDYMEVYKKCYSCCKRRLNSNQPFYGTVASLIQSLITQAEPCFAMFGPGLEDLDESLVLKLMTSPEILPLAGVPSRQMRGIGSGLNFHLNGQKFNILTLYSKTRKERLQAKEKDTNPVNKMFNEKNLDGTTQYTLIEHVKHMCGVVDGFIYVADAEVPKRRSHQIEVAWMSAMLDPALGPSNRPLLVLSCISYAQNERIPCVHLAHQLQLSRLGQPWRVQDTEVATLIGLLDGIQWLVEQAGHRIT